MKLIMPNDKQKTIAGVFKTLLLILGGLLICLASYQMFKIIYPYRTGETNIDFLLFKQHIIHLPAYRLSFYAHIFPSLMILAGGLTQFSNFLLKKLPFVHIWVGRAYVALVLVISAPAALFMSFYAEGGVIAKIGFVALSLLWWVTTFMGYWKIRNRKIEVHKMWMIRSYALTLSAVSLRVLQYFNSAYLFIEPLSFYTFLSWFSWIGNLVVAEMIIVFQNKSRFQIN